MCEAVDGQLLRIYIGEDETAHGRPLYQLIVEQARHEGLAGVTARRGICGYAAGSRIHRGRVSRVREDVPAVIEIADSKHRVLDSFPCSTNSFATTS